MPNELKELAFYRLGRIEYGEALELQFRLQEAVASGKHAPGVLLLEHPPVLTLGKNADDGFLGFAESHYRSQGIGIYRIERGGEVTAHEPGQLVAYPILDLPRFRLTPKKHVAALENSVIATLKGYGLEAATDPQYPGVWIDGSRKICAIGVRIKDRVTMHGIGFNVENSLALFQKIVPCGISDRQVTTMARELGRSISVDEVGTKWAEELARVFGVKPRFYDGIPDLA